MKKETLLEKAKKVSCGKITKNQITDETCELCIAWVKNEITLKQASTVIYGEGASASRGGNILYFFASVLKRMYEDGKIIIK